MCSKRLGFSAFLMLVSALLLVGCQSQQVQVPHPPTKTFDINVSLDPSVAGESITIDMFAVSSNNMNSYKSMVWDRYRKDQRNKLKEIKVQVPGNKTQPVEIPYVCTISYTQGKSTHYTLGRKDPQWTVWKNYDAEYLVIFTDHMSSMSAGPLIIPLHQNCWKTGPFFSPYQKNIDISLDFQGIHSSPSSLCIMQ